MSTVADLPNSPPWTYSYRSPLTLNADGNGYTSAVTFNVPLVNLASFVTVVGGTHATVTTSWGSMLRVIPLQHPLYSGLYANRVSSQAFGTPSGTSNALADLWSHVKVTVEFGSLTYGITGDDAFLTKNMRQGSVYTTQPGRKFNLANGERLDQESGVMDIQNVYELTLFQCQTFNDANLDTVAGSPVNNATFMGKAAGHMLYGGCDANYEVKVGGVVSYTRTLTFTYRSYPWNQAYGSDGVLYDVADDAGNPPYADSDYNLLFA